MRDASETCFGWNGAFTERHLSLFEIKNLTAADKSIDRFTATGRTHGFTRVDPHSYTVIMGTAGVDLTERSGHRGPN